MRSPEGNYKELVSLFKSYQAGDQSYNLTNIREWTLK